jgi:transcriptional regulator with XRE-family HTH domain
MKDYLVLRGMELHEKITKLAEAKGMNQSDVMREVSRLLIEAGREGVSLPKVHRWHNGGPTPDLYEAVALAKVLGVPVEFLADDSADTPPGPEDEYRKKLLEAAAVVGYEKAWKFVINPAIFKFGDFERGPDWSPPE